MTRDPNEKPQKKPSATKALNNSRVEFGQEFGDPNASKVYELATEKPKKRK